MSLCRCYCACLAVILLLCGLPSVAGCVRAVPGEPVKWDLTPSAQVTYATLLLDQSIRSSDRAGILEAVDILARLQPAPQPFSEAAAWFLLNRDPEQARSLLQKAIVLLPEDLGLRLLMTETWLSQGEAEKAVGVLQDFQKGRPDSPQIRQELGIVLFKAGRYAEAEQQFGRLAPRDRTPYVRYCRGRTLLALNRASEAIEELRGVTREEPDFTEAWTELARAHEAANQPKAAAAVYEKLLDQDPGNQDVWLRLIRLELNSGRHAKALELAHNGPGNYGFVLTAVTLFLDAKRYDEAQELLDSIRQEPDVPEEVYFYLAAVAYEKKRSEPAQALEALERVTPESRFYDRALRFRIQIFFETGNIENALENAEKAVDAFPGEKDFRLMQAQLLMNRERWDDALGVLDKADPQWPDDPELRFIRGTILDALGMKDQALELMENIVRAHPDHYQALNYVGYSLAERGQDLDRALDLLRRADQLSPDTAYILDSLAWAQHKAGDVRNAWNTIRKTVRLPGSDDAAIWDHYGDIALALGKKNEARKAWRKALTLNPEDPAELRRKLSEL